jgi:hypothetical protein
MTRRILCLAYAALLRSLLAALLLITPALAVPPPDSGPSVLILQSLDAQET